MAKLIGFEVLPYEGGRVVGKAVTWTMAPGVENPIPGHWQKLSSDGTLAFLATTFGTPNNVGWMGDYDAGTGQFTYIAGVLAPTGATVPDGYDTRDIPACTLAHSQIEGSEEGGDIYMNASALASAERDAQGYAYDEAAGGWEMEVYDEERFLKPMMRGEKSLVLDYWSPCRKA